MGNTSTQAGNSKLARKRQRQTKSKTEELNASQHKDLEENTNTKQRKINQLGATMHSGMTPLNEKEEAKTQPKEGGGGTAENDEGSRRKALEYAYAYKIKYVKEGITRWYKEVQEGKFVTTCTCPKEVYDLVVQQNRIPSCLHFDKSLWAGSINKKPHYVAPIRK